MIPMDDDLAVDKLQVESGEPGCCDLLTEGLDGYAESLVTRAFAHLWRGVAPSFTQFGDDRHAADVFITLSALGRCEVTDDRRVVGAHGLTQRATSHRILADGVARHTWCGFDAIGIPAALEIDAVATTACPHCAAPIEVCFTNGEPESGRLVVWIPGTTGEHLIADFCSRSMVFCTDDHLEQWRRANPGDGDAITVARAARLGRDTWHDVAPASEVWKEHTR
jgi:hypothetical protein